LSHQKLSYFFGTGDLLTEIYDDPCTLLSYNASAIYQ
jgi:hypothetical protein